MSYFDLAVQRSLSALVLVYAARHKHVQPWTINGASFLTSTAKKGELLWWEG